MIHTHCVLGITKCILNVVSFFSDQSFTVLCSEHIQPFFEFTRHNCFAVPNLIKMCVWVALKSQNGLMCCDFWVKRALRPWVGQNQCCRCVCSNARGMSMVLNLTEINRSPFISEGWHFSFCTQNAQRQQHAVSCSQSIWKLTKHLFFDFCSQFRRRLSLLHRARKWKIWKSWGLHETTKANGEGGVVGLFQKDGTNRGKLFRSCREWQQWQHAGAAKQYWKMLKHHKLLRPRKFPKLLLQQNTQLHNIRWHGANVNFLCLSFVSPQMSEPFL